MESFMLILVILFFLACWSTISYYIKTSKKNSSVIKENKKDIKCSSWNKIVYDGDWIYYASWDNKIRDLVTKRTKKRPDEHRYEFTDRYGYRSGNDSNYGFKGVSRKLINNEC